MVQVFVGEEEGGGRGVAAVEGVVRGVAAVGSREHNPAMG
jgi:hypothetical protein